MNYFLEKIKAGEILVPAGDFAEIGVWKGVTFKEIVELATKRNVMAHAFDSFEGMATPTSSDFKGNTTDYPKGSLSVGGVKVFMSKMAKQGIQKHQYKIWKGFIPRCFETVQLRQKFALVRIDVDQYKPTLDAAYWAWDHLKAHGVMLFHDYFPDRDILASKAIKEFLADPNIKKQFYSMGIELFVRKV